MKDLKIINENPFNIVFGFGSKSIIERQGEKNEIIDTFSSPIAASPIFILTGVRGCGKTSLLSSINNYFNATSDWIVININPLENINEQIAAGIYNNKNYKFLFLEKEFSFSFSGISFSIKGNNEISDIISLIKKMLEVLKKKNKRVLISIDEVSSSKNIKSFIHTFQILHREGFDIFAIFTGLYENVSALENEKTLTFLYRAPKIELKALNLNKITDSYKNIFKIDTDKAKEFALLTKGYAYAYQVLGSLLWKKEEAEIDDELLSQYDEILANNSYEKIYIELPQKEKELLKVISNSDTCSNAEIQNALNMKKNELSVYKSRLKKRGIIDIQERGVIKFTLPRFKEFIKRYTEFYD